MPLPNPCPPPDFVPLLVPELPIAAFATACGYGGRGRYLALMFDDETGDLMLSDGGILASAQGAVLAAVYHDERFLYAWLSAGLPAKELAEYALLCHLPEPSALYAGPREALRHWLDAHAPEYPPSYKALLQSMARICARGDVIPHNMILRALSFATPKHEEYSHASIAMHRWLLGINAAALH